MSEPRASIVIPVKNGAKSLAAVLDAAQAQEYPPGFEILVIDSGSSDGSVDIVRRHGVRALQILPGEFNHGGTRNLGASETSGEFIVFLTHDSKPVDSSWLKNLVAPFDTDDSIAGCFGKHVAYPDSDPIDAWRLEQHFANFGREVRVFRRKQLQPGAPDAWMYDFFSDNNSALRRSAWERYPYPLTSMGEDQQWAKTVMEAGLAKAYVPGAVVYHSHSYGATEWFRRWFDEFAAYRDMQSPVQMRDLASAWRYLAGHSVEDVRYLRDQGAWWHAPRAVINNLARSTGAYLGSNYPRLPLGLRRRISLQPQRFGEEAT